MDACNARNTQFTVVQNRSHPQRQQVGPFVDGVLHLTGEDFHKDRIVIVSVFLPAGPIVRGIVERTIGMTGDGVVKINDQFFHRAGPLSGGVVIDQFLVGDDLLVAVIADDVQCQAFDLVVCPEEAFCPGGATQADFKGYGFRGGFLEHFLLVTLGATPCGESG